jgi:hypothetical protein
VSTPLDVLEAQLSAHGWERADPILSPDGSLYRYVSIEGATRTQWVDVQPDGQVEVWGGGLGGPRGVKMDAGAVVPFLRERGAM